MLPSKVLWNSSHQLLIYNSPSSHHIYNLICLALATHGCFQGVSVTSVEMLTMTSRQLDEDVTLLSCIMHTRNKNSIRSVPQISLLVHFSSSYNVITMLIIPCCNCTHRYNVTITVRVQHKFNMYSSKHSHETRDLWSTYDTHGMYNIYKLRRA